MRVLHVTGDLLDTPHQYIAHGCNTQGRMASGVALQIATRYPEALMVYLEKYHNTGLHLGDVVAVKPLRSAEDRTIFNCITQEKSMTDHGPGFYADYGALARCVAYIDNFVKERSGMAPVAFPRICCGEAGGDWEIVERILETSKHFIPVVYTLPQTTL